MTKTVSRRLVNESKAIRPGGDMRAFLDAAKAPARLITPIERHLLTRRPDPRSTLVLHPSEIVSNDWCHRASYHLLRGAAAKPERNGLRLSSIFGEGHAIHHKWQQWLREMGHLYGKWACLSCGWDGWATSPPWCPHCVSKRALVYNEVPLESAAHRVQGHSDGWVTGLGDDCLIEIKSVGLGTVRMEAPALLAAAEGDLDKLWNNIRRPFPKHLRQGQLYLALAQLQCGELAPKEIVFLYENKMNQAAKEFVVGHDPDISGPLLEDALDIVYAVEHDREPACNVSAKGCAQCRQFA